MEFSLECRSIEAKVESLHIIEFDVESGPADRELGLEDLSHGRAQLPVDAGADPADGDELTVRRRFFARRERHGHRAVYRHHDVGFGLADDPGDCLGAVLEDVGSDDGVHWHVGAQDQRRHPACAPCSASAPLSLRLRLSGPERSNSFY